MNSISDALLVNKGSLENTLSSNKIVSATPLGLKINQDATTNNVFSNNQLINSAASTKK
ncbi:MAG: hypothetical protein WAZ77_17480 [Candidatus Nitrosopolaris sp.]